MNGTNLPPFTARVIEGGVAIEHEVGRLAQTLKPADDKPEPVTGRMLEIAEHSAKQIETASDSVEKMAAAVAAEGRELAATLRKNAEAFEAQVASFAEFAKGVTVSIREASTSASTFVEAAE